MISALLHNILGSVVQTGQSKSSKLNKSLPWIDSQAGWKMNSHEGKAEFNAFKGLLAF